MDIYSFYQSGPPKDLVPVLGWDGKRWVVVYCRTFEEGGISWYLDYDGQEIFSTIEYWANLPEIK